MINPHPPTETEKIEKLTLELEEQKIINTLMQQQMNQLQEHINQLATVYGLFTGKLANKPHYLTSKELYLYKHKGLEALLIAWQEEIDKIDANGEKKHGFPLPK